MKNLIIASTSTLYGGGYLDYILKDLDKHFKNLTEVLFIPYAQPSGLSYDDYTQRVSLAFSKINKQVIGIHTFQNPIQAIQKAQAIFVGGGNTFVLLNQLYKQSLITPLKESINRGIPYLGTSAGSNICGLTIKTTNDMPIVYPPSFNALGIVPFNINPHYQDPNPNSTHMGETRATRIHEFHHFNTLPVVGLREGSWLEIKGPKITLKGHLSARIFEPHKTPFETSVNSTLDDLK